MPSKLNKQVILLKQSLYRSLPHLRRLRLWHLSASLARTDVFSRQLMVQPRIFVCLRPLCPSPFSFLVSCSGASTQRKWKHPRKKKLNQIVNFGYVKHYLIMSRWLLRTIDRANQNLYQIIEMTDCHVSQDK
jgi:hypothetical protein